MSGSVLEAPLPSASAPTAAPTIPMGLPAAVAPKQALPAQLMSVIQAGADKRKAWDTRIADDEASLGDRAKALQTDLQGIRAQVAAPPPTYETNPAQAFGSFAAALGTLGSLMTRHAFTNALNASSDVLETYHKNDQAATDAAYKTWKQQTETATTLHKFEQEAYSAAVDKLKVDRDGAAHEASVTAAALNDQVVLGLLRAGRTDDAFHVITGRDISHRGMVAAATAFDERHLEAQAMQSWAKDYTRANGHPPTAEEALQHHTQLKQMASIANKTPAEEARDIDAVVREKADAWTLDPKNDGKPPTATQMAQWRGEAKQLLKPNAGLAAALSDDALTLKAEQILAGDKSAYSNLGYGSTASANRAKLSEKVTQLAKERGMTGPQLAALNAEYAGTTAGERTLGNRSANIGMAVSEARLLTPLALSASEKVSRTNYPALNSIMLAAEQGTGDENVVQLGIATNSLINTYARAISPTGVATVSDKDHARELLSTAWSNGQYKAGVEQLMLELDAARKSPGIVREEFRNAVTGAERSPQAASIPHQLNPARADAEYAALPSGAHFIGPDGVERVKP